MSMLKGKREIIKTYCKEMKKQENETKYSRGMKPGRNINISHELGDGTVMMT